MLYNIIFDPQKSSHKTLNYHHFVAIHFKLDSIFFQGIIILLCNRLNFNIKTTLLYHRILLANYCIGITLEQPFRRHLAIIVPTLHGKNYASAISEQLC